LIKNPLEKNGLEPLIVFIMPKTDFTVIQALDRGLKLLQKMADTPQRKYNLAELAAFMQVDRSSVHRMLSTLIKHRLVSQEKDERVYSLGLGIYKLATALEKQLKLTELINPFLRELVRFSGETAHTVVRSGVQSVFVDSETATEMVSIYHQLGHVDELHSTAVGKSLLCQMSLKDLEMLFEGVRLVSHTPTTIIDIGKLALHLQDVRKMGYSTDKEERSQGVLCMDVPIYDFRDRIVCAVGISGPKERMKGKFEKLIPPVKEIGQKITQTIQGFEL